MRESVPPERPGSGSPERPDGGVFEGRGTDGLGSHLWAQRGVSAAIWEELFVIDFERGLCMRENLKKARKERGLTQQTVADLLGINLRHYQKIEYAELNGSFEVWDALEDLLGVHQRKLRETPNNHHVPKENP